MAGLFWEMADYILFQIGLVLINVPNIHNFIQLFKAQIIYNQNVFFQHQALIQTLVPCFSVFLCSGLLFLRGTMVFFRIFIFQRVSNSYNQSVFMQSKAIFITIITLFLLYTANTQTISTACFSGQYYSSATGKCQQCDISCAQCTSSDGCSLCYDQMYLTPVGNKVLCGYCYDILAGCTVCSSAYKCARCSNGFYLLSNSTCTNCSTLTPNCALCYQNSTTSELYCTACTDPLVLVQGTCVANATASQIQASRKAIITGASAGSNIQSNVSSTNKSNTSQTQQQSVQNVQNQTQTALGQTVSASIQTINCDLNFVQVGTVCTRVIPFCIKYETTTLKCDVCVASYSKSVQGYCIPDILLLSFQTNLQNMQLSQAAQISTNIQNNSNTQTEANTESMSCPDGQYLWFGSCVIPGTECTNRDVNNKCTNCIKGYTLRNGLCIQQILPASTNSFESKTGIDSSNNKNGGISDGNTSSSTDVNTPNQAMGVLTSGCTLPCVTCRVDDLKFCLTCVPGMTIVDVLPGICYNQN